jgi:hypothetical protein
MAHEKKEPEGHKVKKHEGHMSKKETGFGAKLGKMHHSGKGLEGPHHKGGMKK